MAACPAAITRSVSQRRPLILTQRRLDANRRNAARSSGPRTPQGKARVARNAIKHGFFAAQERWTPQQHRDFEETRAGLCDDLRPQGALEENCVAAIAESYVRMAALLRYENLAALKHHQHCERDLEERIAAANEAEAARLRAQRESLRRAGLWGPTIPGPRETMAIVRYEGCLNRTIRQATSTLEESKKKRLRVGLSDPKSQKQTHYSASPNSGPAAAKGPHTASPVGALGYNDRDRVPLSAEVKNAKTNPLSSMFTGNRHQRRRARALAARRR